MRAERDLEAERCERNRFILLQHACALTEGDPTEALSGWRLGESLGFGMRETRELVEQLVQVGFFRYAGEGFLLSVTREGVEQVERFAERRRSVRQGQADAPLPEPATRSEGSIP